MSLILGSTHPIAVSTAEAPPLSGHKRHHSKISQTARKVHFSKADVSTVHQTVQLFEIGSKPSALDTSARISTVAMPKMKGLTDRIPAFSNNLNTLFDSFKDSDALIPNHAFFIALKNSFILHFEKTKKDLAIMIPGLEEKPSDLFSDFQIIECQKKIRYIKFVLKRKLEIFGVIEENIRNFSYNPGSADLSMEFFTYLDDALEKSATDGDLSEELSPLIQSYFEALGEDKDDKEHCVIIRFLKQGFHEL